MLLIDAYNVLHVQGVLPPYLAGLEVDGLARLIGVSRYARQRVVLVCDGAAPRSRPFTGHGGGGGSRTLAACAGAAEGSGSDGIRIVHAGGGRDADTLIEEMLRSDSAARRWTVVSSDRRVQRAAISAGGRVLEAPAFLRQLVHDDARPAPTPHPRQVHKIPLDRLDVALWIREFGVDPRLGQEPSLPAPREGDTPAIGGELPAIPTPSGQGGRAARLQSPPDLRAQPSPPVHIAPVFRPDEVDPVLRELLDGLEDGIRLEDLDMRRWLGEGPSQG